jgi:hypothetical protein
MMLLGHKGEPCRNPFSRRRHMAFPMVAWDFNNISAPPNQNLILNIVARAGNIREVVHC